MGQILAEITPPNIQNARKYCGNPCRLQLQHEKMRENTAEFLADFSQKH
jgi:hypothetical protein